MRFEWFDDVERYKQLVMEGLLEKEAQNNVAIGVLNSNAENSAEWLMGAAIQEDGELALAAVCTPPFNILLHEAGDREQNEALALLVEALGRRGVKLPGVLAERGLANRFARLYAQNGFRVHMSMYVMKLEQLAELERAPGYARAVQQKDLYFVPYWEKAFAEECMLPAGSIQELYEKRKKSLENGGLFLWVDEEPVAQAGCARNLVNGKAIANVYTPPQFRGKGYATSLVAHICKKVLESGAKFCVLYADAANPISCGIYKKIGFTTLCLTDDIRFEEEQTSE